jgi:hypothetical protein
MVSFSRSGESAPRRLVCAALFAVLASGIATAQTAPPPFVLLPTAPARAIHPKILYPYHYGNPDPFEVVRLLADEAGIEVPIRDLK